MIIALSIGGLIGLGAISAMIYFRHDIVQAFKSVLNFFTNKSSNVKTEPQLSKNVEVSQKEKDLSQQHDASLDNPKIRHFFRKKKEVKMMDTQPNKQSIITTQQLTDKINSDAVANVATTKRKFPNLFKDFSKFAVSYQDNEKYRNILNTGKNNKSHDRRLEDKKIIKKIPVAKKDKENPNKAKFNYLWIAKQQPKKETINELLCGEPIRMLLGEDLAPKYRIVKDKKTNTIWTITRMLKDFRTISEILKSKALPESYKNYCNSYFELTSELVKFNKMVAVCLLFGKDDLHLNNWGAIDKEGKKYAATVDHGMGLTKGFSLYEMLYKYGHRKEQFLTPEFADNCKAVVKEFEQNRDQLKQSFISGIKSVSKVFNNVPTIQTVMEILDYNKHQLEQLAYQIEAEIAINEGNPIKLRNALQNLDKEYVPLNELKEIPTGDMLSQQNYRDGFVDGAKNFKQLIQTRLCKDCDQFFFYLNRIDNPDCYTISNEYQELMTEEDQKIEQNLLAVYNEIAQAKNPNKHVAQLVNHREVSGRAI